MRPSPIPVIFFPDPTAPAWISAPGIEPRPLLAVALDLSNVRGWARQDAAGLWTLPVPTRDIEALLDLAGAAADVERVLAGNEKEWRKCTAHLRNMLEEYEWPGEAHPAVNEILMEIGWALTP